MARGEVGYMNRSEDKNKTDSVRVKKKKTKGQSQETDAGKPALWELDRCLECCRGLMLSES